MADVIITPVSESVFNVSVNVVDPDLAQLAADAEASAVSAAASAVEAATIAQRYNFITPNIFAGQGLTDDEKIQASLDLSITEKKSLLIPYNDERDSNVWIIDKAILLYSDSIIYIENSKLKLSDTSRDNIFRTKNCGIGITNPQDDPLHNISIIGIGDAEFEGADNPRATGDAKKTLSINVPVYSGSNTYGTDATNLEEKQTGDWRNIGIILAYTTGIRMQGFKMTNMHAYGISCERSKNGVIRDIHFDNDENRTYNGSTQIVKNTDGIDILYGGENFTIENIYGNCGDDPIALTIITSFTDEAGGLESMNSTGGLFIPETDSIHDIQVHNIRTATYANNVRLLNTPGSVMYNINVRDVTDTSVLEELTRMPLGATVLVGDSSPVFGGPSPIGSCYNILIDNIKSVNKRYGIRVLGSISESSITNVHKHNSDIQTDNLPAIFFDPASNGSRNLYRSNVYTEGILTSSDNSRGSWTSVNEDGIFQIVGRPLNMADNYSAEFTDLSLINKKFMADSISTAFYSRFEGKDVVDAVNARATTEGFALPDATLQTYLSELIGGMMATGSWNKMDLFLNFAFANIGLLQYGRINWKNPTGNLATVVGGLTYELAGWMGNGTDGYINTNYNPVTQGINYTLNNASRGGVIYAQEGSFFDGLSGTNSNCMILASSPVQNINASAGVVNSIVDMSGYGYKSINRDSQTVVRLYNADVEYVRTQTSISVISSNQLILRRNSANSLNGISMYHMGGALTKDETQGIRSAYNNFLSKLGLNPIS